MSPSPSLILLALALSSPALASVPTFTGDVLADFTGDDVQIFVDPNGIDVGLPIALPPGTISGNDIDDVRLTYDPATDTLFFGINTFGIATDVDGDGDPNTTSPELAGLGGIDEPLIGGAESFAVMLDLDEDGQIDLLAGVPNGADASGYVVASLFGTPVAPAVSFGPPLGAEFQGTFFGAPTPTQPHLELAITNFSTLPTSSGAPVGLDFALGVFLGSLSDAGIGEDFFPGVFQFTPVDLSTCGDGIVDAGEQCDDGNTIDGDGCDITCDVEPGYVCECAGGDALDLDLVSASGLIGGVTAAFNGVYECPPGEVLYGLTGDYIDNCPGTILTMDLLCGVPAVEGASIIISPQGAVPGGRPNGPAIDLPTTTYTLECPTDEVVVGLTGKSGIVAPFNPIRTTGITQLQLECAKPSAPGGSLITGLMSVQGTPVAEGNPLPGDTDVTCDADLIATGVGTWGRNLIDGARLTCSSGTGGCGGLPSECRPFADCGDGVVEGAEECDDGNVSNDDGCTAICTLPECGDHIVSPGEQCDDGNTLNDDTCTSICTDPVCGDGILSPGEDCDDGNTADGDSCTSACTDPLCGDGYVSVGETCDDGNTSNDDSCTVFCEIPVCGDGLVSSGEDCDDGNTDDGDSCTSVCTNPICGDGYVSAGEECDDGNTANGDGCTALCEAAVCGDGIVSPGEACDDGNTVDGDSCSSTCQPGFCPDESEILWDLDACVSRSSDGTNRDFSEFTAHVTSVCATTSIYATTFDGPTHSCTDDPSGKPGEAMCFGSSFGASEFVAMSPDAISFDVVVTANAGITSALSTLSFQQQAPDHYTWSARGSSSRNTGPNNPPAKFGVRLLRDGVEIGRFVDLPTSAGWELRNIDFSSIPETVVDPSEGAVTFTVEMMSYDHQGSTYDGSYLRTVWDLENVKVTVACAEDPCPGDPPTYEICDNLDNDGDGLVDEGDRYRYVWDGSSGGYSAAAGAIHEVEVTYDAEHDLLTFYAVVQDNGNDNDGFFLALSDGPNPNSARGMAAFYFDDTRADPVVTIYAYNAHPNVAQSHRSWADGDGDQSGDQTPDRILSSLANPERFPVLYDDLIDGKSIYEFTVDASLINLHIPLHYSSSEWEGAKIGSQIGLWFHPMEGISSQYDSAGWLTSFSYDTRGYLDFDSYNADQWTCP